MKTVDVAIIGAGAAGLTAAAVAAGHGARVAVLDDNALPGGQYFRQLPAGYRRTARTVFDKDQPRAEALYQATRHPGVEYLSNAVVWESPEEGVLSFTHGAGSGKLRAALIVIASGAADRPVPFPGWTLPGVVTAGGLQNLIKGQRVIPGRRAVVAGNGPLVLLVSASLARAGARLIEAVEAAPIHRRVLGAVPDLLAAPTIVRQAIDYRMAILRAGATLRTGWTVVEARGDGECEEVVVAPIDADGRVDRGRARTHAADLLVTGFGLQSSTELARGMGLALHWHPLRGGWLPVRDQEFETSRRNVFAIGDGAGIGGVEMALAEGRLMGLIAAERLGRLAAADAIGLKRPATATLARLVRFRSALERLYAPPRNYLDLLTPDTVVCRCEEVTADEIRRRQADGFANAMQLKFSTRMGMGRCQGRNCFRTLSAIVATSMGVPEKDVQLPRTQSPARLVTFNDLLQEPVEPPVAPNLETAHLPRGEKVS